MVVEPLIVNCVPPSVIVPANADRSMVSVPEPATQSPPVVSLFELALAKASRKVHWPLAPVTLSAKELTTIVAAVALPVNAAAPAAHAAPCISR